MMQAFVSLVKKDYTSHPMPQIFLFTGENNFQLLYEKKRWIAGFVEKHGEENLQRLDARSVEFRSLMDEVSSAPFLAEKRLIVLEGMPKLEKEQAEILTSEIHPQVLLLIVDPKPDKRFASVKTLLKHVEIKTFASLPRDQLLAWMQQFAKEQNVSFAPGATQHLFDAVGEDQELLSQEIKKLALYAPAQHIEIQHIDELVASSTEQAGWHLMDLLASHQIEAALQFARKILDRGESPHALWSMMMWIMSSFTSVYAAVEQGQSNPGSIASSTGVNFVTVRTMIPLARTMKKSQLHTLIEQFTRVDIDMKTGGIRSTTEAPQEMLAVIDQCLLGFTRSR